VRDLGIDRWIILIWILEEHGLTECESREISSPDTLIEIILNSPQYPHAHIEILPKIGDSHFLSKVFNSLKEMLSYWMHYSRYAHSRKRSSITN
jgi:hypothetical protein